MDRPFFSVIIPTYNRAAFISKAINSVLNQTFKSFELIVVDDGSSDNTEQVLAQFKDDRIRYVKKLNEVRNIARNYGIKVSKGELICFLDSDDYFYPHHLETIYNFYTSEDFTWMCCGYEIRDEKGKLISKYVPQGNIKDNIIKKNFLSINGLVFKRKIFDEFAFLPTKNAVLGEDQYLWLRFIVRYPIALNNAITSVTVEHKKRSLKNIDLEILKTGTYEIINELKNDYIFLMYYRNKSRWYFANLITFLSTVSNEKGDYNRSFEYLFSAFKEWPLIFFTKRFIAAFKNAIFILIRK